MKKIVVLFALAAMAALSGAAIADGDYKDGPKDGDKGGCPPTKCKAYQKVNFKVEDLCCISVSGNPCPLVIKCPMPGSLPEPAMDTSTTYSLTTNKKGMVITGNLDENMPKGIVLAIKLGALAGAVSNGWVDLNTTPKTLEHNISKVAGTAGIAYKLAAGMDCDTDDKMECRTVTLTCTEGEKI